MQTINFKEFGVWQSIDAAEPVYHDVRRDIADGIYKSMTGIAAHDLAFRIFRSEGPIDLPSEDEALLRQFFEHYTMAWMCGSYLQNLKECGHE